MVSDHSLSCVSMTSVDITYYLHMNVHIMIQILYMSHVISRAMWIYVNYLAMHSIRYIHCTTHKCMNVCYTHMRTRSVTTHMHTHMPTHTHTHTHTGRESIPRTVSSATELVSSSSGDAVSWLITLSRAVVQKSGLHSE